MAARAGVELRSMTKKGHKKFWRMKRRILSGKYGGMLHRLKEDGLHCSGVSLQEEGTG